MSISNDLLKSRIMPWDGNKMHVSKIGFSLALCSTGADFSVGKGGFPLQNMGRFICTHSCIAHRNKVLSLCQGCMESFPWLALVAVTTGQRNE